MSGTNNKNYQTEYIGPVGYEKKFHQTHFSPPKVELRPTDFDTGYAWVRIAPGRYRRVKKELSDESQEQAQDLQG